MILHPAINLIAKNIGNTFMKNKSVCCLLLVPGAKTTNSSLNPFLTSIFRSNFLKHVSDELREVDEK
jgi:hypothetical protein